MSDAAENTMAPDSPAIPDSPALSGPAHDTFSRKWQLTFNNPKEHGWTHEKIREVLGSFPTLCYWCMADEIGGEQQTYHTHLFLNLAPSKCRFSTLKSKFPGAHIEKAFGTSRENRDYIMKDGKWKDSEKGTTSVEGTFEEFGECPEETPGKSKEAERILEMLKDGADNMEIVEAIPSAMKIIDKVERTRSMLRDKQFSEVWRDLTVTYIFGKTGAGKTRSVMEKYGYPNCYRVTDYKHPFDTYDGQDVIIFEEFRGGLKHGDMLNYLDGYPILLPCRYFNRQACYTKVFIITNVSPDTQYMNVDIESRNAFYRRIHRVIRFWDDGRFTEYSSVEECKNAIRWTAEADAAVALDFDQLSL